MRIDTPTISKASSLMKQQRRGNNQDWYMYTVGVCLPNIQKESIKMLILGLR